MKHIISVLALMLTFTVSSIAQKQMVSGTIKDSLTGETIVGANIIIKGTVTGTVSDINGNFNIELSKGKYALQASFVGYSPLVKNIVVADAPVKLLYRLKPDLLLEEVEVVADIAKTRQTPVAFTTLPPTKIEERLAGQDLPMLLNRTPGVYATQQGGGDGDARITIRGFSQRNIAVMLDGVPVNDMENGWVYWSNWFGLEALSPTIQVQRGLGASRLALPSVGGTMNIITKGVENKRRVSIEQAIDAEGKSTTSIGMSTGKLKNGWGASFAGSYKEGKGWIDQTSVQAYFFFAKIDKIWGKHVTSISGFGAPQWHEQRAFKRGIADYDLNLAKELGQTAIPSINNRGMRYNAHWGYLKRDADVWNIDQTARVINPNAEKKILAERVNTYFKPQFTLRDSWSVNSRLNITNVLYLSLGTGGGLQPRISLKNTNLISPTDVINNPNVFSSSEVGQINWQSIYNQNTKGTQSGFGVVYPINPLYSDKLYYSNNYLVQNNNNHKWYGLLSNFDYKLNKGFSLSGGADLRTYRAQHYSEVVDMLGGDYVVDKRDLRLNYEANPKLAMKRVGERVNYDYDGLVNWAGIFGLLEYKNDKISSFVNLTTSVSGYKKIDFFGNSESDWKYKPGFTVKTGANYNINRSNNVFVNLGYLSKTKDYRYYYRGFTSNFLPDSITKNEKVQALEFGYSYTSKKFSANLNTYVTKWQNKPTNQVRGKYTNPQTGVESNTYGDIAGMDALHLGVELDFIYKISRKLDFQGIVSIGSWKWDKKVSDLQMYYTDTNLPAYSFGFDATGIHVGDAAQTQLGASLRYEPIKGLYIEGATTFFDRYYADFNPEECTDIYGNPVDSWRMPSYAILNIHSGYRFKIASLEKLNFTIKLNVLNALNKTYITDAKNNDTYIQIPFNTFDARSASVYMGAGTQISTSLKIVFN